MRSVVTFGSRLPAGPPPAGGRFRLPLRTTVAVAVGALVARSSQLLKAGNGGTIGGRVTLALQPEALEQLGRGRVSVLVTGTNGKTTTTLMVARALGALGEVATNSGGANLPGGMLTALTRQPEAPYAVLEVDERFLPHMVEALRPAAVVLLNLSRDQMDRVGELRNTERSWRAALEKCPSTTVVANCGDILVTSAALDARSVVWVSAPGAWHSDDGSCPRCGAALRERQPVWSHECGFARPGPDWSLDGNLLVTPANDRIPLRLGLPGAANLANAALALAAATSLGVPLDEALLRVCSVSEVSGRYRVVERDAHSVRLLLAKNPAGWAETLSILRDDSGPVVIAVNAHGVDGRDMSWLWDVPFEQLRGRTVVASGERAMDLAVRLTYAEVQHTVSSDLLAAIDRLPAGPVDVVSNYTAFLELSRKLAPHD